MGSSTWGKLDPAASCDMCETQVAAPTKISGFSALAAISGYFLRGAIRRATRACTLLVSSHGRAPHLE